MHMNSEIRFPFTLPFNCEMERGCVEDQPQRVGSSKASGACSVLRLVEDDTAALRVRFSGAIQSRLFADVDPTLSRNWTNKPLTGQEPD